MATAARKGTLAVALATGLAVLGGVAVPLTAVLFLVRPGAAGDAPALTWAARGLLFLALAWLVIGMLAARTRLVRRPGAAAARATWISSTRPWRARESSLGLLPLDRWLMLGVPAALLVGTRVLQSELTAWSHLIAVLAGWAVFAGVVRLLVGRRSPWPVIAAVGGGVVIHSILALAVTSIGGPDQWWGALASSRILLTISAALAFAAMAWTFVAGGWALAGTFGARRAAGMMLAGVGAGVAVTATLLAVLEDPAGPTALPSPWAVAVVAALVAVAGAVTALVVGERAVRDRV
jgi:hypothetical protein